LEKAPSNILFNIGIDYGALHLVDQREFPSSARGSPITDPVIIDNLAIGYSSDTKIAKVFGTVQTQILTAQARIIGFQ
jgi:hypothetical protein